MESIQHPTASYGIPLHPTASAADLDLPGLKSGTAARHQRLPRRQFGNRCRGMPQMAGKDLQDPERLEAFPSGIWESESEGPGI